MTTALDRIVEYKREEIAALKRYRTFEWLERDARARPKPRGFAAALSRIAETDENALICEIKRKSPSAGEILPGADPVAIAKDYEAGGAACLSVLTDGPSFGGSLADFAAIRAHVGLPMLRKDFMLEPIQIVESRAYGADCVLIIMSCLSDAQALELTEAALIHDMDVLVETHDEAELERALRLPSPLIGVNNRDLKRMVTQLETTERLAPLLPADRDLVAESGIASAAHIQRLRPCGARRFLIGESLMKVTQDRAGATRALREAR
jgi:indole-3-glycerol phosphate synthase